MSTVRDMGVSTHWEGTGDGGSILDWGVYLPPPEHGCKIYCELSYPGLVFDGGAEASNVTIE